ncbi:MAG: 2-keto-4-pentenoate hydratase/2-oxohepta-3-ene-1,7-dioic acid hydratase in catechol pathway [Gammaproteobacteria bacterium]|jgi:2-keto-4-pentenoate hydratase/2-oxohepta-3-ene-1,7-dioic acid hydratase in catechol pathway
MTTKIICVGRNYEEHITELGSERPDSMVLFFKPPSSISELLNAELGEPLHYEGEICFQIKGGKYHSVGFGLDLTKRQLQSQLKQKGLPWERSKAFDGAACFSEFIELKDHALESLHLKLEINGSVVQTGGFDLMIYKPIEILEEIQSFLSLEDNDIVMTGTPKGVGQVYRGDVFRGSIFAGDECLIAYEWKAV